MFKWWPRRRQRAVKNRFNSGYNYAVGELLRGDKTEGQLEVECDCQFDYGDFERGMVAGMRQLRENYISRADASEIQRSADLLSAQRHWIDEGARPGTFKPALGYQESFLNTALSSGAVLTGKPDGSESITVVFSLEAWRAFGLATAKADQKS